MQISRAHPSLPRTETIEGVRHIRVRGFAQPRSIVWLKFFDLLYSLRARRALPEADIVVTNTFWLPLLIGARDRGLVYVHVARGPKGQMRWYRKAARLQAVSRAIGDAIIAQAPELRAKVRVITKCAARFVIFPAHRMCRARRQFCSSDAFIRKKDSSFSCARWLRFRANSRNVWKVKIIGPHETKFGGGGSEYFETLQKLAADNGVEIEWHPAIFDDAELARHYRGAFVFVYPSLAEKGEAMPVAPLEAMANGCVPLVSNLDCFRDYIQDRRNRFCVRSSWWRARIGIWRRECTDLLFDVCAEDGNLAMSWRSVLAARDVARGICASRTRAREDTSNLEISRVCCAQNDSSDMSAQSFMID